MGGSSDKKPAAQAAQPALPALTPLGPAQTFPAAMPGQLDALSQQLSAGYGQNPADIMAMLQSIYKPITTGTPVAAKVPVVAAGRGGTAIKAKSTDPKPFTRAGTMVFNRGGNR